METQDKVITEKRLSTMEQKIDNIIEVVKEIKQDLKNHIAEEENKFAGKWVEKLTLAILGGIVVGVTMLIFK